MENLLKEKFEAILQENREGLFPSVDDWLLHLVQSAYELAKSEDAEKINQTIKELKDLQQDARLAFMFENYKYGIFTLEQLLKSLNPTKQ